MAKPKRLACTALLLKTNKEHRLAAAQDGADVADGLGGKSLTRHGAPTKAEEFKTAVRVNNDIMRHGCDIQAEKGIQQAKANNWIRQHFAEQGKRLFSGEQEQSEHEDETTH